MEGAEFDEVDLFRRLATSGARVLLIGRRALVVLGLPVLTADYDFWLHSDDAGLVNDALDPLGFVPTMSPEAARMRGRYALENGEHLDILLARSVSTVDGAQVAFDDVWNRRQAVTLSPGVDVALPDLDDLIATKRFSARPKDLEDIRLLQVLKEGRST